MCSYAASGSCAGECQESESKRRWKWDAMGWSVVLKRLRSAAQPSSSSQASRSRF